MSRYIDADLAIQRIEENECYSDKFKRIMEGVIDKQPTVDAVPVVRCGECNYHTAYRCKNDMALWSHSCRLGHGTLGDDWFCADGERRTDEQQT